MLVSTKDLAFESVLLLAPWSLRHKLDSSGPSPRRFVFTFLEGQDPVLNFILHFLFPLARRASWHAYYDETSQALTSSIVSLLSPFLLSGMDTLIYYCTRHFFGPRGFSYMLTWFNP